MIQSVLRIERAVKERRDVDVPLVNWWLYILLLNWITGGIYSIYLFFKRAGRINKFIRRKRDYYLAILEYTEKYSQEKNKYNNLRNEINDLKDYTNNYIAKVKELKAGLSLILSIITLGIYRFIYLYKINKIWNDIQNFETEFYDKLSQIWIKLGILKYPVSFNRDPSKNRGYIMYLFLSIVTCGIFALIWDYKIHTDPDNLYKEFHSAEDTILNAVRND